MVTIAKNESKCSHCADVLKALGHPIRLRLVALLCDGDWNVGAMAEHLELAQSVVYQPLGILRTRGLVATRREEGRAVYRLAEPRLKQLIACIEGCTRG